MRKRHTQINPYKNKKNKTQKKNKKLFNGLFNALKFDVRLTRLNDWTIR
jgi:hypothetical protein